MANGHGGSRFGSGRKPRAARRARTARQAVTAANVVAIDGGRAQDVTPTPPADLPEEQRDFWKTYAGLAITAGTLTKQTEPAFRLLCEQEAERRAIRKTLDEQGRTFIQVTVDGAGQEQQTLKAHPLMAPYRQLTKSVEALLARFCLAPFGKPVAGAGPRKPVANPWAAIAGAAKNGRP